MSFAIYYMHLIFGRISFPMSSDLVLYILPALTISMLRRVSRGTMHEANAKKILADGIDAGIPEDKLKVLYQQLHGRAPAETSRAAKGQTAREQRTKLAQDKKSNKIKALGSLPRAEPSQDQINILLEHYRAGRLEEAEALARSLTQLRRTMLNTTEQHSV